MKNPKSKKDKIKNKSNLMETNIKKNKSIINKSKIRISKFDDNLQELDYEKAIIIDKRSFMKMYFAFFIDSQIILDTFFTKHYFELFIVKLSFLIFTFQISFFLNALFYSEDYIPEAYHNNGVLYFISGLPKSIYSFLITLIITNLLRMLSSSKSELMKIIIQHKNIKKYIHLINIVLIKLRKKLIAYFILIIILGIFFLYYATTFCAVYYNSQKYWIFGCIQSFGLDSLSALIICIFITSFRYLAIKKRIKYLSFLLNIINTFL